MLALFPIEARRCLLRWLSFSLHLSVQALRVAKTLLLKLSTPVDRSIGSFVAPGAVVDAFAGVTGESSVPADEIFADKSKLGAARAAIADGSKNTDSRNKRDRPQRGVIIQYLAPRLSETLLIVEQPPSSHEQDVSLRGSRPSQGDILLMRRTGT